MVLRYLKRFLAAKRGSEYDSWKNLARNWTTKLILTLDITIR